ncbi:hypothetical protein CEY11_21480 [Candidimonas nitroreducens]|uniref:Uncharacterized protein n=2 Tax=Candidimonas nitroreducens TaxID=683354 RepID=A0A225M1R7_9BURK|nr:hypothetical protein CEY11_21480 [Candidimonas nitroreducens]
MGSFAAGLVNGFITGKKMRAEQELHDLQVAKLKKDQAMQDELQATSQPVKPVQTYVVTTPDGSSQTYVDKKTAQAAQQAYGGSAQMTPAFSVAGQTFTDKDQANSAAAIQNTPVMQMQRRMEIANRYGNPQLADAYGRAYSDALATGRSALYDTVAQARATGDPQAVIQAYNASLAPTGSKIALVGNGNGAMVLRTTTAAGKTFDQPVKDMGAFFDMAENAAMSSSANAVALHQLAQRKAIADAQIATTQRGQDLAHSAAMANVGVAQQGLTLRGKQFDLQQQQFDWTKTHPQGAQPRTISGVDKNGNTVLSTVYGIPNGDGTYGVGYAPPVTVPGMSPIGAYNKDPLTAMIAAQIVAKNKGAAPGTPSLNVTPDALKALIELNKGKGTPAPMATPSAAPAAGALGSTPSSGYVIPANAPPDASSQYGLNMGM